MGKARDCREPHKYRRRNPIQHYSLCGVNNDFMWLDFVVISHGVAREISLLVKKVKAETKWKKTRPISRKRNIYD